MPLLIDLKNNDKLIINGAVIENTGAAAKLLVHNKASILRGKEVLFEEDAVTPASRTYFALQCAYMFPEKQDEYIAKFARLLGDYVKACPSAQPIKEKAEEALKRGNLYGVLKKIHTLIDHEGDLIKSMAQSVEDRVAEIETENEEA